MSRKIDVIVLTLGIGFPLLAIGAVLLIWPTMLSDLFGTSRQDLRTQIDRSHVTVAIVTASLHMVMAETGEYPSSAPTPGNEVNAGIEAVATLVYRKDLGVGRRPSTVHLGNTDGDRASSTTAIHGKPDRFEFVDAWGHPLVYLLPSDYMAAEVGGFPYRNGRGEDVRVRPWREAGRFREPDSFQLFSMGPDGRPNTEDDVADFLR